jgi:hypothetical protein
VNLGDDLLADAIPGTVQALTMGASSATFSASPTSATVTVNHGLGVVPDFIYVQGVFPGVFPLTRVFNGYTSTQFQYVLTDGNDQARTGTFATTWLCIQKAPTLGNFPLTAIPNGPHTAINMGTGTVTFTASVASNTVTITHGLGTTPVFVGVQGVSLPGLMLAQVTAANATTFQIKGGVPGVGPAPITGNVSIQWLAIA